MVIRNAAGFFSICNWFPTQEVDSDSSSSSAPKMTVWRAHDGHDGRMIRGGSQWTDAETKDGTAMRVSNVILDMIG